MRSSAYNRDPRWAVWLVVEVAAWVETLTDKDYEQVVAALRALEEDGPSLGRPFVDQIKSSEHKNMKELRPRSTNIRLLFAFDPNRQALVLVAGDKTNNWEKWYLKNIPLADKRLKAHLKKLQEEK
ncbi:MAG: type II toxin-antitoxin system RelE/ParE family toxin [Actinomycetes bacterium]|jgi:hypothetical protein